MSEINASFDLNQINIEFPSTPASSIDWGDILGTLTDQEDLLTALNLKANLASPTFTGTVVLPSTTSIGTVSSTELSYLDGVTSGLQSQLDGKQSTITGGASTIVSSDLTIDRALVSNASGKVAVSSITSTELSYLSGVSSSLQTQLNSKQATITGGATTIVSSDLTASRALVSDINGKVAISSVTSTELGYLAGVTSSLQSQLDLKAPLASPTFTGTVNAPTILTTTVGAITSAGILLESNSGTDIALFGAGGGAGATFYGGVLLDTMTSGSILFAGASGLISQDNSSLFFDDTNNRLGLLTTAPTHTVTMGSTGTGIALYNTADQTTNFEFGGVKWQGNVLFFGAGRGGSGTVRSASLQSSSGNFDGTSGNNTRLTVTQGTGVNFNFNSSSNGNITEYIKTPSTFTASSVVTSILSLSPVINMTNTAGYTILLINPTETATGSGTKLLQDRQVGGSSKAVMTNAGSFGIGVTAPTTKIQVYAGSGDGISLLRSDVTAQRINIYPNDNTVSCLITGGGNNKPFYIASVGAQSLHFGTNYSSALNEVKMTIDSTGRVIYGTNSGNYISASSDNATAASGGVTMLYSGHATSTNNVFSHSFISSTRSGTTGTIGMVKLTQSYTPSGASSANYNGINLGYTINATAGAGSGTATGIFVNATETSLNGITHNLIDLQVASSSKFKVTNAGAVTATNITTRIVPRVTTITSSATPTINTDNCDAVTITALATAITSMTTNLTGTPNNFDKLTFRIKDDGTARAISRGSSFEAKGVALPTTTVISKVLTVGFIYDTVTSKRGCVASCQET